MYSSGSSSEEQDKPGPSKKAKGSTIRKYQGAATYKSKFQKEWTQAYPFLREVQDSFFCTICGRNVSCSHMGRADVERHIGKPMHQANAKSRKTQSTLPFIRQESTTAEKVCFLIPQFCLLSYRSSFITYCQTQYPSSIC